MSTDILNSSYESFTYFPAYRYNMIEINEPTSLSNKKEVRFSMYTTTLDEQDNIFISKTKQYDGTLNEFKRYLPQLANTFYQFKLSSDQKSLDYIQELIGSDSRHDQMEFVSYCKVQVLQVIQKFHQQKESVEEDKKEIEKEKSYEKNEKDESDYWSNKIFDVAAFKKTKKGVALILEPSRDMLNMKFGLTSSDLIHINAFLTFLEKLEESIFFMIGNN